MLGVLQGDTLAPYIFIICLDYVLRTSLDLIKDKGLTLKKRPKAGATPHRPSQMRTTQMIWRCLQTHRMLLHYLEKATRSIGLYVNSDKTEYMCYWPNGDIFTLDGKRLKVVDNFTYLGRDISSTERDINTRIGKAWTAMDRLSTVWKSDLTDKLKREFFQAVALSVLQYGCIYNIHK